MEGEESLVGAVLPTLTPATGSSISANALSRFGQMSDAVACNSSRHVLYDANAFAVANASTADGHVAPARAIPVAHLQGITGGVTFDWANDCLYVGDADAATITDASMIQMFDHLSTAMGR